MTTTDIAARVAELRAGLALLSRLPLPPPRQFPNPPAVWAWPLVGLVLGGLATALAGLALWLGVPVGAAAALWLGAGAVMTGALHEDGLADSCDGLWGGWDRARRLEIMKDSHIGSYGVMGLIVVALARWSAVAALLETGAWPALIAAASLSRAPMAALMAALPNARGTGLSASVGRPSQDAAALAAAVAALLALLICGWAALAAILSVALAALALAMLARRKIGGQTGDILGASQQISEMLALISLAAAL